MGRLEALEMEKLEELSDVFELAKMFMGFVPNSLLIMARRPDIVRAFTTLAGTINGPGNVDAGLKRLIAEVASKAAGCQYCVAHTAHSAHNSGIDEEKLENVWTFEQSDKFTTAEKAALRVAMGAAQVPNLVTDEDFSQLKQHYSDDEVVEIVAVISLFGFLNRWNDTMATSLEEEPKEYAETQLPKDQWSIGKHTT